MVQKYTNILLFFFWFLSWGLRGKWSKSVENGQVSLKKSGKMPINEKQNQKYLKMKKKDRNLKNYVLLELLWSCFMWIFEKSAQLVKSLRVSMVFRPKLAEIEKNAENQLENPREKRITFDTQHKSNPSQLEKNPVKFTCYNKKYSGGIYCCTTSFLFCMSRYLFCTLWNSHTF